MNGKKRWGLERDACITIVWFPLILITSPAYDFLCSYNCPLYYDCLISSDTYIWQSSILGFTKRLIISKSTLEGISKHVQTRCGCTYCCCRIRSWGAGDTGDTGDTGGRGGKDRECITGRCKEENRNNGIPLCEGGGIGTRRNHCGWLWLWLIDWIVLLASKRVMYFCWLCSEKEGPSILFVVCRSMLLLSVSLVTLNIIQHQVGSHWISSVSQSVSHSVNETIILKNTYFKPLWIQWG